MKKYKIIAILLLVVIVGVTVYYFTSDKDIDNKETANTKNVEKDNIEDTEDRKSDKIDEEEKDTTDKQTWIEWTEDMGPSDPNKVLSSGVTLQEAKLSVDDMLKMKEEGLFEGENFDELLEELANNLGTSMAEINALPVEENLQENEEPQQQVVQQPQKEEKPVKQENPSGNSNSGGVPSGGGLPPEADKNGNGLNDFLEDVWDDGTGTTVHMDDDEIELKAHGDEGNSDGGTVTEWDKDGNGIKDSLEDSYVPGNGTSDSMDDDEIELEAHP